MQKPPNEHQNETRKHRAGNTAELRAIRLRQRFGVSLEQAATIAALAYGEVSQ